MAATINVYQQMLDQACPDNHRNALPFTSIKPEELNIEITQRAAYVAEIECQLKESQKQSEKYLTELERLRKDYQHLEFKLNSTAQGMSSKASNDTDKSKPLASFSYTHAAEEYTKLQDQYTQLLNNYESKEKYIETLSKQLRTAPTEQLFNKENRNSRQKYSDSDYDKLRDKYVTIKSKYDTLTKTQQMMPAPTAMVSSTLNADHFQYEKLILDLTELRTELSTMKSELEVANTAKNRAQKQAQVLTRDLEKAQTQFQALINLTNGLNGDQPTTKSALNQLEKQILDQSVKAEYVRELEVQISELANQLKEKNLVIEQLKRDNEMFRSKIRKLTTISANGS